ncbi:MAG TPA: hypothetical protein VMH33_13250 [Solirubrobacterales bacterium]|nr:hypothetical protein [Solirubrobacterales bacterium]
MTSFRRVLFGYRRPDVDAALAARDSKVAGLERRAGVLGEENAALEAQALVQAQAIASQEADLTTLSGMVIERERTIRELSLRLDEANACHERSIASLDAVSARLEELQAQARGQATRIRMKALREAVEVSRRAQELVEAEAEPVEPAAEPTAEVPANGNGHHAIEPETSWEPGLHTGRVRLDVGPLGDFSQLVGFEDAVGMLGATDISVERFSEGRATFSMRLDQPVDLLAELEGLPNLDFKVRHTAPDNLVLDLDEDGSEHHAA